MPLENTRFAKSGIEKYQLATLDLFWSKESQISILKIVHGDLLQGFVLLFSYTCNFDIKMVNLNKKAYKISYNPQI
jgi:hypothetical protein